MAAISKQPSTVRTAWAIEKILAIFQIEKKTIHPFAFTIYVRSTKKVFAQADRALQNQQLHKRSRY